MSGKPAARQGDMTQYGGPIVQGSAGVRIGAPTGVACSVCPGGMTSGNPVNPLLGAKVLPGETDLALPGPLPFILSRTYSSYRTKTPAPVGVFGPGWKAPSDIRLQLRDDGLILNDNGGRSIHFEPLLPGEAVYSRSESMWLVRGGKAAQPDGHTLARLWGALPPDIRLSPHLYLATNSAQGPKVLPGETDLALPGPLPFILSRTYSSYRTRTPAPVGVFGPGWKAPSDIRLQLRDDALVLNDNGGRSIHFEPLLPGEAVYSRSESMWLVRGGKAAQPDGHTLARLWGALPPDIRLSPHLYLATNSAQGQPGVACAVRADGGATGQTGGAGIHTGAKSSSLSLRPPGTAAGAYQRRRQYGVERGI